MGHRGAVTVVVPVGARRCSRCAVPVLLLVLASAATDSQAAAGQKDSQSPQRPNFVIIMADDLGYGDLSCYGNEQFETPHLDALAASGMRFTDFHSSGAVCSPTRAGLVTGRYQQRAGIPGVVFADPARPEHKHGLQAVENTVGELLGGAGYQTALFGKWHLGYEPQYNPTRHGFGQFRGFVSGNIDYFSHVDQAGAFDWWIDRELRDEPGYSTHLITRHAVRFIREKAGQPFFLYVAHEAPHYPYQGPGDEPVRAVGKPRLRNEPAGVDIPRAYREMVQAMDAGVGQILDTLRETGQAENTLVMFFSDNGATRHGSNGPWRGSKGTVWEGGHRVPCIAAWPGRIAAGSETKQLAITLDITPTVLDFAEVRTPQVRKLDGRSLRRTLAGEEPVRRNLYWQHGNDLAMRRGDWKLIRRNKQPVQLYNLASDPAESTDVSAENASRARGMLELLLAWKLDTIRTATPQPRQ